MVTVLLEYICTSECTTFLMYTLLIIVSQFLQDHSVYITQSSREGVASVKAYLIE